MAPVKQEIIQESVGAGSSKLGIPGQQSIQMNDSVFQSFRPEDQNAFETVVKAEAIDEEDLDADNGDGMSFSQHQSEKPEPVEIKDRQSVGKKE